MRGEPATIAEPASDTEAGYRSPLYAASLSEFGRPLFLPRCGGWLLERTIGNSNLVDATSPYPLFCCADWSLIDADLIALGRGLVSVTLVTDPTAEYSKTDLRGVFDVVSVHTNHYLIDTTRDPDISKSHLQNARRALRKVDVEVCNTPSDYIDEWVELYGVLSKKHGISGLRAFSIECFESQLSVPGMVMFRAVANGRTVGLDLWYLDGLTAQGHLAAFSSEGYKLGASYATKFSLIEHFKDRVRWINFGGLPNGDAEKTRGLQHFKSGWANDERPAYICGRILDRQTYRRLSNVHPDTAFFPAYRAGEF